MCVYLQRVGRPGLFPSLIKPKRRVAHCLATLKRISRQNRRVVLKLPFPTHDEIKSEFSQPNKMERKHSFHLHRPHVVSPPAQPTPPFAYIAPALPPKDARSGVHFHFISLAVVVVECETFLPRFGVLVSVLLIEKGAKLYLKCIRCSLGLIGFLADEFSSSLIFLKMV